MGKSGFRQSLVKSPWVPGVVETYAVLDSIPCKYGTHIEAQDYPTLMARRAEVITAFRQKSYSLIWTTSDGASETFVCLRAAVTMEWKEEWNFGLICSLQLEFLRQPTIGDY